MKVVTVKTTGKGTKDDPIRPDVPPNTRYRVIKYNDDGTVTIELLDDT